MRAGQLRFQITAVFLLYTLPLLGLVSTATDYLARSALEDELGRRLIATAQAAAMHILPAWVEGASPGDEETRSYLSQQRKLRSLRDRTTLARVYVFDRTMTSRCDSEPGVAIGTRYHQLLDDSPELTRLFAAGQPATSTLFRGSDGGLYKTGYAPVWREDDDGRRAVVAAVAVDGSAEFFARLTVLRRYLIGFGVGAAAIVVVASLLLARAITRPIAIMVDAAQAIGKGELTQPIPVRPKNELGLLAQAMDEMRQGIRDRDQRMQMMLAGIAHEVRNPLAGIELWSGLLREELADDPKRSKHVAKIERELVHLGAVVTDFLDFAREKPPLLAVVNLGELVREVAGLVGDIDVVLDAPASLSIEADVAQMRRVILNLLRNAAQACASAENGPGKVTVQLRSSQAPPMAPAPAYARFTSSTSLPQMPAMPLAASVPEPQSAHDRAPTHQPALENSIRLVVEDNGCGIEPKDLASIFTPFFTTKERGTGLGLALARKVVDAHGGRIHIDSELGKGTRVTVELPCRPS